MNLQTNTVNWKKTLLYSGIAVGITGMLTGLLIAGYAMMLGIQAQGAPDTTQISLFADQIGGWADGLTAVLTFFFARHLGGRKQGTVLGVVTAVFSLIVSFISSISPLAIVFAFLIVGAGTIGGMMTHTTLPTNKNSQNQNSAPDWMSGVEE